jgi:hypothetical protein
MKKRIYLSLWLLSIGLLTGCSDKEEPPVVEATPAPIVTPTVMPSPLVAISPSPLSPSPQPSPVPIKIPATKPVQIPTPKSIYPAPKPVAIKLPPAPVQTKAVQKEEPVSKLNIPTDPAQQIMPDGIGTAKIGMTFRDLKQQMGEGVEFAVKTSFIDGFDAIAVTKVGKVQYYIPYPTGTKFTDEDRIQHLMTDNPNYRTEQGVGPGTTIEQASSVYGNATLSLSKENESREFINFTQHPNGLAFRPKPVKNQSVAGDYPESNEEYLKTQKYDKKAAIGQITVSCVDEQCGQ